MLAAGHGALGSKKPRVHEDEVSLHEESGAYH